jgi:hypothetical protein
MWDKRPAVAAWWERVRTRPSVEAGIFKLMTAADHAPFQNLAADPWPQVKEILAAA